MSNLIKTSKELQIMKEGGQKLSAILTELFDFAKEGINLLEIESKAVQLIKKSGGEPGFMKVPNYHWATCININDEIVHGVPKDYILKNQDVLNIDIGLFYKGLHSDMSGTVYFRDRKDKEIEKFLETGRKALKLAEKKARENNRIGHISQRIQQIIEKEGYNCARNLTGHGIGKNLHEEPMIPCILNKPINYTPILKQGMTLAIEVIYMQGEPDLVMNSKDGWTIKTKDGKISAVFEETVAVSKDEAVVLTKLPF